MAPETHKYPERLPGVVTDSPYVVAIKSSARRRSRAVGDWVNDHGTRRCFESKPLAQEWAREASGPHATVWIQDAAPADDSNAAGYLVGGERHGGSEPDHQPNTQAPLVQF